MSAKPAKIKKLTPAQVKERDARQKALMERRVGSALASIADAFAASRPKKTTV